MSKIKCTVLECAYNKNAVCHASSIQVNHNGVQHSSESRQTQCETFRPKDL